MIRVALIGRGAIGGVIADHLAQGHIEDVTLTGILRRSATGPPEVASLEELLETGCDLVIEAAGHEAVRSYAAKILEGGIDLIIMSAGALADPSTEQRLRRTGPGRLHISSGAIGGFDILRAMALAGTLESVTITTTAVPEGVREDIEREELERISNEQEPVVIAKGTAREVALAFPRVTNVAAALGLDNVESELQVDPKGRRKRHLIEATAGGSDLRITLDNEVAPGNPRTSAVTPYAALRFLHDLQAPMIVGT